MMASRGNFFEYLKDENPNFGLPSFVLGIYHKRRGDFLKAQTYFHLAQKMGYDSTSCHLQLIDIELLKRKWENGLEKTEEAIKEIGTQPEFDFLKGYIHYHLGDVDKAINCYEQYINFGGKENATIKELIGKLKKKVPKRLKSLS